MSLLQRKFFVIANKTLGAKLYKTQQTVKKYQQLFPNDLSVEQFDTESQALIRLSSLKKEHIRVKELERTINRRQKEAEKSEMNVIEVGEEEVKEKVSDESGEKKTDEHKPEFNYFYFFKENEELFKNAQTKIDPIKIYHMFFDGASRFNPGPAGCGYAFFNDESQKIYYNSLHLGKGTKTNNQAEYFGLIYGLRSALNLGIHKLHCYGDSELVIKQMTGLYGVKSKQILGYHRQAVLLKKELKSVQFTAIGREDNDTANRLAVEGRSTKKK